MSSAAESSQPIGRPLTASEQSRRSYQNASNQSILFAAASPASPLAALDDGSPKATTVGCGPSSSESFAIYDPDSCLWKIPRESLTGDLQTYSGTFPPSGMTRSGTAYRLPPSVRVIKDRGSLWWPTPLARDFKGIPQRAKYGDESSLPGVLGGSPNPNFVEWLMGFPAGWTSALTEPDPSETQLSQTLPSSLEGDS